MKPYIRKSDFYFSKRKGFYSAVLSGFRPFTQYSSGFGLLSYITREGDTFIYRSPQGDTVRITKG